MRRARLSRRRTFLTLAGALAALVVAGCSASSEHPDDTHGATGAATSVGKGLPSEHVHGIAFNPGDDKVYLATHDGLFRYDSEGPVRVGPVIDLMGFTAAGPNHFYSSGHPGEGVDLPNPVGLMESTDAGQTWTPLSRQGQTDFHALAASQVGVVGFDGASVIASTDGRNWTTLEPPVPAYSLATSPDGKTLVVTSRSGPARSSDSGSTWAALSGAPILQFVHFVDNMTAVGVAPDGAVHVSEDAGASWRQRGTAGETPQALTTRKLPDGETEILVVTASGILRSIDSGRQFTAS